MVTAPNILSRVLFHCYWFLALTVSCVLRTILKDYIINYLDLIE